MSIGPTQKRMCNPCGIPDAKFFSEKVKRAGEPQRDKPLEGLKKTMPSADDGVLEQLFTLHDSTTVPHPSGGRKLVLPKDDGHLKEIYASHTRQTQHGPMAKIFGWVAIGMAVFMLLLSFLCSAMDMPEMVNLVFYVSFVVMHVCMICSLTASDGRTGLGLLSLVIFYPGIILWFIIRSFL